MGKNNFLRPRRLFFHFRRPVGDGGFASPAANAAGLALISFSDFTPWIYGLNLVR